MRISGGGRGSGAAGAAGGVALAPPAILTGRAKIAQRAIFARVRGGVGPSRDRSFEASPEAAVIGRDVREPDGNALAGPEDEVGRLGLEPPDLPEGVAVERELQGVFGPRMPGQLRVQDLVAPGAPRRGTLDPLEEVRDPPPPVRQEDGLIEVGAALADRPPRR